VKFGINAWCWGYPFYEEKLFTLAISRARRLGFDGMEVPLENPQKLNVKKLRETLETYDMSVSSVNPALPHLASSSADTRREAKEALRIALGVAREIGSECLLAVPSAVGKIDAELPREKEWNLCLEAFKEAGPVAADNNVCILVEAINRFETYFINTVADAARLVREVNHPNVKLLVDTFHMNIEELDILKAIRDAGDLIHYVHANENDRGQPGAGHIPFPKILKALKDLGYHRWLVIETFKPGIKEISIACIWRNLAPDQDTLARDGLRYLQSTWFTA
jgi:D-psicose/D-tagatose/L-ribulose 3-epimerase